MAITSNITALEAIVTWMNANQNKILLNDVSELVGQISQSITQTETALTGIVAGNAFTGDVNIGQDLVVSGNSNFIGFSTYSKLPFTTKTATAKVGTSTATAAQLAGGIITVDTSGGAADLTTDIATAIDTQFVGLAVGDTFQVQVLALGANAVTLLGGTDVTVTAPTVAANSSRIFTFRKTATGAYTTY